MKACEQMPGLSTLEHGFKVSLAYEKLISELDSGLKDENLTRIYRSLKSSLLPSEVMRRYQVFRDCGKPFCQPTEERKFPDHEVRSFEQWKILFPEETLIAELMLNDMRFHTGENSEEFYRSEIAPSLYFTAWAELFANAEMFGGQESTSFKIKKKRLIAQGKKMMKALEN